MVIASAVSHNRDGSRHSSTHASRPSRPAPAQPSTSDELSYEPEPESESEESTENSSDTDNSETLSVRLVRVLLPLGEMAGVPARVALRSDGSGVMFTSMIDPLSARAVVLEGEALERTRPSKKKAETPEQFAARLAFTDPTVRRGGHVPGAAPAGCKSGTSDAALVQRVATALALADAPASDASICNLDGSHRAVVGTSSG